MRASSGTIRASASKSSQSTRIPAARATATKWIVWLVEPVASSSAPFGLTIAFLWTRRPRGYLASPSAFPRAATATASRVSASRSAVPGLTNDDPGSCRPIASSSTWLELAVP